MEEEAAASQSALLTPLSALHSTGPLTPPGVHRMGYKAKRDYVIYQILVHCGGINTQFLRVQPMGSLFIVVLTCSSFLAACYRGASTMPLWGSESPDFLPGW